jgi:lipopolysaccharide cholinephosphotransferase
MEHFLFPDDKRTAESNPTHQVQAVILRMLRIFDMICNRLDIDYWLDYGTLLGAVRHQAIIPWDVEADIGMLRPDYLNFIEHGLHLLPKDIFFQTRETDPLYLNASHYIEAKLRDKFSNYSSFAKANPSCRWHNGIQIDIFVYDTDDILENCITNAYERILTGRKSYFTMQELEYLIPQSFSGHSFPVPIGFDPYLKRNYGDYLIPPPVEEQVPEYEVDLISPCNHTEILYWPIPSLR